MLTDAIGENAGKVWQVLKDKGSLNIAALKKSTKLDDKSLYLALGWLAREGKLTFEQKQRQMAVGLAS